MSELAVVDKQTKVGETKYGSEIALLVRSLSLYEMGHCSSDANLREMMGMNPRTYPGSYIVLRARAKLESEHEQVWKPYCSSLSDKTVERGVRRLTADELARRGMEKDIPSVRNRLKKSTKVAKIALKEYESLSPADQTTLNVGYSITATYEYNLSKKSVENLTEKVIEQQKRLGPADVNLSWFTDNHPTKRPTK